MERPRRNIPGTISVQGREFVYIESGDENEFAELFDQLTSLASEPLPNDSGMITENAILHLPDGRVLHGVSYRGDLKGCRRMIQSACESIGAELAMIEGDGITLSDGTVVPLADCVVEFY